MTRVTLSVAMCAYNGAHYLREQLRSIAAQTRLPDELVVCDDHSTDKSIEILRNFAERAPFVVNVIENSRNVGSTKNFEGAFGECKCEIIAPCDQDDSWYPEKLALTERVFVENPQAGVVFTDADIVDENLAPIQRRLWDSVDFTRSLRYEVDHGKAFDALLKYNFVTGATMAFRAKFKTLINPIPESWIHDAWVSILLSAISEVVRIDRPLMKYRQHSRQQFGPARRGIRVHLSGALAASQNEEYARRVAQYNLVLRRLQEQNDFEVTTKVDKLLQGKIEHLACRARLPKSHFGRIHIVARELLSRRYRNFGHGWKAAARDLIVKLDC